MSTENSNAAEPDGEDLGGDEGIDDSGGELSSVLIPRDFPSTGTLLATSKSGPLLLRRDQGDVAVL